MSLADSLKSLNEFDINDLDINNAGIWPAPIKAIVALIIFGLILGGGYWFFIKDQYAQLDRVERTEQELKQQYERKAYQVANLDVFKAQMAEMEETFGALVRQLPSETEVPGLLEDITNTALGSGLSLQQVALVLPELALAPLLHSPHPRRARCANRSRSRSHRPRGQHHPKRAARRLSLP